MKNYLKISDIPDFYAAVREAVELKNNQNPVPIGKGKTLGMLFFNPSLRTRISTEKAAKLLGMDVIVLNADKDGWALEFEDGVIMNSGKAEHIKEAAGVLSQYCDIIAVRAFPQLSDREKDEEETILAGFEKYACVPIVNLESATGHPLQALTDAMTIAELKKVNRPKVVLSWAPHPKPLPQSVPNSFVEAMKRSDVDLVITNPEGYDLRRELVAGIPVLHDQDEALRDADFVYVKNWSSYDSYGKVLSQDSSWTFSKEKLALTNDANIMHCLPVRRNVVIDDEVLDSKNSIVIKQAGNRTYAAMAVLKNLLESRL